MAVHLPNSILEVKLIRTQYSTLPGYRYMILYPFIVLVRLYPNEHSESWPRPSSWRQ